MMKEQTQFIDNVSVQVIKAANSVISDFNPKGKFVIEHYRNGNLLDTYNISNTVVNDGKNKIFDVMFNGATQLTAWYIGLIDNSGYTSTPNTDTMSSHAGWTEFTTYSQSTRVEWAADSPVSQSITNGTAATFDITGSGTLRGIFIASNSTKSGTSGTLWATSLFGSTVSVVNGDVLKITYTVSA